jgi:ADP-heptose:LPS heptosyltransferase
LDWLVGLSYRPTANVKPTLLIIELWGLGDLVIATPFLRAATEKFAVTLVAKPYAQDLQQRLWPEVEVVPFVAPWTAFQGKYHLWKWPWTKLIRLRRQMKARRFDVGLSARWDPRDHLLLRAFRVRRRIGFPRVRSQMFLTDPLQKPDPRDHRYEYWRQLGTALELHLPERNEIIMPRPQSGRAIFVHTGAGQPIRVWPLERYQRLIARLRADHHQVIVACDPDQLAWWQQAGETTITAPRSVNELTALIDQAGVFIGNDSGPGHLAAFCGVPTFTLFGPQLPEWFAPLHPESVVLEGKACPYRPCSDYCRFPAPRCLWNISEAEVWEQLQPFLAQHLQAAATLGAWPPNLGVDLGAAS